MGVYLNSVESFAAMEFGLGNTRDHVRDCVSTERVGEDASKFRVAVGNVPRSSTSSRELRDDFSEGCESGVDGNTFLCTFTLSTGIPKYQLCIKIGHT
jgi:hypothetical protein